MLLLLMLQLLVLSLSLLSLLSLVSLLSFVGGVGGGGGGGIPSCNVTASLQFFIFIMFDLVTIFVLSTWTLVKRNEVSIKR